MQLWAGRLLIFVAVGHLVLAGLLPLPSVLGPAGLPAVLEVPWHPLPLERQVAFWTFLGSFAGPQLLWGIWIVSAARAGHAPPRGTGLALLALTALQVTLAPVGGFWLNIVPGLLLLGSELPVRSAGARRPAR